MGIFRFNPPAPHCLRKGNCKNCPSNPKYWKLTIEEFTVPESDEHDAAHFDEAWVVLEWSPEPSLQIDGSPNYCFWEDRFDLIQKPGQSILQPRPRTGFFHSVSDWALKTYGSYEWNGSLAPNTVFEEWHVSGGAGTVVYTRAPPKQITVPADHEFWHFRCLRENRLWYAGSDADPGGEENPLGLIYPESVIVEPYWP